MTEQESNAGKMTPEIQAFQMMCKQLFKSRLFRGYYSQRCYVESLNSYRDVVVLQRSERELESQLLSTMKKLIFVYMQRSGAPNIWVGVTNGSFGSYNHVSQTGLLKTCVWVELSNLAFGEYWFSIRSVKFRDTEVLLKLKVVRPVDAEPVVPPLRPTPTNEVASCSEYLNSSSVVQSEKHLPDKEFPTQIGIQDFVLLVQEWGISIKQTIYYFMAHDVNKANILALLKFIALLFVSIVTGTFYALRFLGLFTLRFMFEFSRFTHVATPLLLKVLEVFNKCIGGILILFMTMWKDLIGNRGNRNQQMPALTYETKFMHSEYEQTNRGQRAIQN